MLSSFDRTLRALAVAFVLAAAGFVLLTLRPSQAPTSSSPASLAMIQGFLGQTNNSSPSRVFSHWEDRLAEELKRVPDVRRAAEKLAPEFGLSVVYAERLIVAWVRWMHAEHAIAPPDYQRPPSGNVAADLYELVRKSNYDPHVIKLAAPIVENLDGCTAATLDRLTGGSPNKPEAVWAAATAGWYCEEWWIALNRLEPMNDAVLWGTAASSLSVRPSLTLSILEHVERSVSKARLAEPQATIMNTSLSRRYLRTLFDAGLAREGADYVLKLPEQIRQSLLDEQVLKAVVKLGGHDVSLNENADILAFFYERTSDFRLEISAALYLSGHVDEAHAIFKTVSAPGSTNAFKSCGHMIGEPARIVCSEDEAGPIRWRLLDLALEKPHEDPYELVESQYGSGSVDALSAGLWIQVALRRLTDYRTTVAAFASRWNGDKVWTLDGKPVSDVLAQTFDRALVTRAEEIARRIALVQKSFPPVADTGDIGYGDRPIREAKGVSRFRRVALPKTCPAPKPDSNWKPPAVPTSINRISDVEQFWRVETAGSLVVVVGQMWSSGIWEEEGLGGVWIHVSQDGGKTWETPLFTGLESNTRFMVRADPCVSHLDGDHIVLEYWLMQIMRTGSDGKLQATTPGSPDDRFAIDIPLSALRRDSDGDGLTDIVEESLLLNPRNRDSDGDGVRDGEDAFPNLSNKIASDLAAPMAEVLNGIVDGPGPRRREPADIHAKPGAGKVALRSRERPLVFFADPQILAGISADRVVLVFSDDDLRRLAKVRSQVSGTRIDQPIVSRSRDRGYLTFDNGLTGGTFTWRREGDGWKVEQSRSFIR